MPLSKDQERMKTLLTEAVTVLCKNGINYQHDLKIDCLLGVTIDYDKVILVTITEQIHNGIPSVPVEDEISVVSEAISGGGHKHQSRKRKYVVQPESDRKEEGDFCPEPTPKKLFRAQKTMNTRAYRSLDDVKNVSTAPHVYGKGAAILSNICL